MQYFWQIYGWLNVFLSGQFSQSTLPSQKSLFWALSGQVQSQKCHQSHWEQVQNWHLSPQVAQKVPQQRCFVALPRRRRRKKKTTVQESCQSNGYQERFIFVDNVQICERNGRNYKSCWTRCQIIITYKIRITVQILYSLSKKLT